MVKSTHCFIRGPTQLLTITCDTSDKGSDGFFLPPQAPGTPMVHIHTRGQNTHTEQIEKLRAVRHEAQGG